MAEIIAPTVAALGRRGIAYRGVLFAGLMIDAEGPKLIEYNVRFGDPECQVLMMRLKDDLLTVADRRRRRRARPGRACAGATRRRSPSSWRAKGYPGAYRRAPRSAASRRRRGRPASKSSMPARAARAARLVADWRPRAQCHRRGRTVARGAGARLRGGRPHRLAGRLLPPRHRLARGQREKRGWRGLTAHVSAIFSL